MLNLKDNFVKNAYEKIKQGTLKEDVIFSAIELYIKRPLTDLQKQRFRAYIEDIKSGRMSFDDYWSLYKYKTSNYEKNI